MSLKINAIVALAAAFTYLVTWLVLEPAVAFLIFLTSWLGLLSSIAVALLAVASVMTVPRAFKKPINPMKFVGTMLAAAVVVAAIHEAAFCGIGMALDGSWAFPFTAGELAWFYIPSFLSVASAFALFIMLWSDEQHEELTSVRTL